MEETNENELTTYSYISNGLYFEYFVGYELATLIGYKNTTQIINSISKSNQLVFRDFPGVKEPELDPRTILITRDGVIEILLKTRKRLTPDVLHLLKEFNIDTTNKKCLTKEQQTLSAITNAFKTEKYEDQLSINEYYLDLYFTEYKIVVECDENGHQDRKPYDERLRMDFVNLELGITDDNWIRYNPDEHDFDISKIIGKIYRKMEEIKQEKFLEERRILEEEFEKEKERFEKLFKVEEKEEVVKIKTAKEKYREKKKAETVKKVYSEDDIKECKKCNKVLSINEFFPDKEAVDGKQGSCKECVRIRQEKYFEEARKNFVIPDKKVCKTCEEELPMSDFYNEKKLLDGKTNSCKECIKAKQKERAGTKVVTEKHCNKCNTTKNVSEFYSSNSSLDGFKNNCKTCSSEYAKEVYQKNQEKILSRKREKRGRL
jgi:very-short-patch-repair endonuclease